MSLHISILYGSVREARAGIRLVRFLDGALERRGHTTSIVDAAECKLPLLNRMYKEYERGTAPRVLEELAEIYRRTDAFAIVIGEYNHGIPPGLKNLLDHFLEEYFFRPSAIVCYSAGQFGGVRAAMQLRMTLAELGMSSIPSLLPIPVCRTPSRLTASRPMPGSRSAASVSFGSSNGTPRGSRGRVPKACHTEFTGPEAYRNRPNSTPG
jgi:NAD(P)H-dependent FMN reductase